jgi:hypothetical protein
MNDIYLLCSISKQAHFKNIKRLRQQALKEPIYLNLMYTTREIHPGMSLRKVYEKHEPEGIGRDAFIELGMNHGYRLEPFRAAHKTTFPIKSSLYGNLTLGLKLTDVNQVWTSDLTYFDLNGKTYYIVLIMDVYSRRIIGYSIADNMRAENTVRALRMALNIRGIKNYEKSLIHHSDRGVQYASNIYTDLLEDFGIRISMCSSVYENIHIERANGTIKNQYLRKWHINNQRELFKKLDLTVWAYNNDRPHDSLDKMTPVEFENYVKELNVDQKPKMRPLSIIKRNSDKINPNQLVLDL